MATKSSAEGCSAQRVLVAGDCNQCKRQFYNAHRLPESHACAALSVAKAAVSNAWVTVTSELASVTGLVVGTLTPQEGLR